MDGRKRRRKRQRPMEQLTSPAMNGTFQYAMSQGRRMMGFAETGDKHGWPAIVIGGHGCTRVVGAVFGELASQHGVRLIWPERPGYGLSEECKAEEMTVLHWADCVLQLADHLGLRKFSLIGQSVGSVFALAIARFHPDRIVGPIYLISPWVSTSVTNSFRWTRLLPAAVVSSGMSLAMDIMGGWDKITNLSMNSHTMATSPDAKSSRSRSLSSQHSSISSLITSISGSDDWELFDDDDDHGLPPTVEYETDFPGERPLRHVIKPRSLALYLAMQSVRDIEPSQQGQILDILVALEKYHTFGFDYSDITVPVSVVWGDKDTLIPSQAITWLAKQVPDIRIRILEGEDHDLVWKEGVMEWAIRGVKARWAKG